MLFYFIYFSLSTERQCRQYHRQKSDYAPWGNIILYSHWCTAIETATNTTSPLTAVKIVQKLFCQFVSLEKKITISCSWASRVGCCEMPYIEHPLFGLRCRILTSIYRTFKHPYSRVTPLLYIGRASDEPMCHTPSWHPNEQVVKLWANSDL